MSEKPFQKPQHGVILEFKGRVGQPGSAPDWVGTDLARFAQDVVALNSRTSETPVVMNCRVAPLENMQRGLRIKKKSADDTSSTEAPVELSRFRKE